MADRDAGITYRAVGQKHGVTFQQARIVCVGMAVEREKRKAAEQIKDPREIPIRLMQVGSRAKNCLWNHGLLTVGDILDTPVDILGREPNFGKKTLAEIKNELLRLGIWWTTERAGDDSAPRRGFSSRRDWLLV